MGRPRSGYKIKAQTDLSAPLPLGFTRAVEKAVELRRLGPTRFTWSVIADIMREYHGVDRAPNTWAHHVKQADPALGVERGLGRRNLGRAA